MNMIVAACTSGSRYERIDMLAVFTPWVMYANCTKPKPKPNSNHMVAAPCFYMKLTATLTFDKRGLPPRARGKVPMGD